MNNYMKSLLVVRSDIYCKYYTTKVVIVCDKCHLQLFTHTDSYSRRLTYKIVLAIEQQVLVLIKIGIL